MKKNQILITGASGCVGQYITSWLFENSEAELYLWLREPKKFTAVDINHQRINLLIGDLREANRFKSELSTITRVIHTATAWGDPARANEVNLIAVKNLLNLLNPNIIEQIIYFSTASILKQNLDPLPEAFIYGTEYIQTKAKCLESLQNHELSKKIIAVFPTLVFGGSLDGTSLFPTSYLTEGLKEAFKWIGLARWIRAYSRFHFIHAADIAFICGHLATSPHYLDANKKEGELTKLVLGQPAISIDQAIDILLKWKGMKRTPSIPLWGWLVEILIKVLPIKINAWDRFSIRQRHFIHSPITSPETFGGRSYAMTLQEVLHVSGLKKENQHNRS